MIEYYEIALLGKGILVNVKAEIEVSMESISLICSMTTDICPFLGRVLGINWGEEDLMVEIVVGDVEDNLSLALIFLDIRQ